MLHQSSRKALDFLAWKPHFAQGNACELVVNQFSQ
jgi:hypothetical protein